MRFIVAPPPKYFQLELKIKKKANLLGKGYKAEKGKKGKFNI